MRECGIAELRLGLEGGSKLLDVREYGEYAGGHIAGAIWIPLRELEHLAGGLERSERYYVICRSGRRSLEAQKRLLAMGFKDVINVRGGMMEWEAAGQSIERDPKAVWSVERQVRLVAGLMVLLGAILSQVLDARFIWLSAFVGLGLIHAAVTDSCAMGLLLARLPWNRPKEALKA